MMTQVTLKEEEHVWLCRFCEEELDIIDVGKHLFSSHIETFEHVLKVVGNRFMCLVCDVLLEITEIGEHFLNSHLHYWKVVIRVDKNGNKKS